MNKSNSSLEQASQIRNKISTLPVTVKRSFLSAYPNKKVSFFRSSEIVFLRIINGEMFTRIQNKEILLKESDVLILHAQQSADLYANEDNDCTFSLIYVDLSIFESVSHLGEVPLNNPQGANPFFLFTSESPHVNEIIHMLDRIQSLQLNRPVGFEYEILAHLFMIVSKFYSVDLNEHEKESNHSPQEVSDIQIQKEMLAYIHEHFCERILLDDIAASGKICRSKCCSIFRKHIKHSPIEYLNAYRLEKAQEYLLDHSLPIAAIAAHCGFSHQSYFTKLYSKRYGYTPNEFRKGKNVK